MGKRKDKMASDTLTILDGVIGDDPEMRQMIAEERINLRVARLIYEARTQASLTQAQLAERIGTTKSVIARLEDADYEGHSLSMLRRLAQALGLTLVVDLVRPTTAEGATIKPVRRPSRPRDATTHPNKPGSCDYHTMTTQIRPLIPGQFQGGWQSEDGHG